MQCLQTIHVEDKQGKSHQVPCGKCAFCLTNKRASWMFRIHHEMRNQLHPGWVLTLTYDERHVRRLDDGRLSLRFRDIQLYIKRIRKAKFYVKYICVGEYGSDTKRPHYHMLLWTDAPTDFLQNNWKSSKDNTLLGHIHFDRISMAAAMYTLKYIIQPKQKADDGLEPTRAQFSHGLGLSYLTTKMYDYHTNNDASSGEDYEKPVLFSILDGAKVALPRYYKGKIFTKYQLKTVCRENKERLKAERADEIRKLNAKGIVDAESYLLSLRTEIHKRIISKTKHNQTL